MKEKCEENSLIFESVKKVGPGKSVRLDHDKIKNITPYESVLLNLAIVSCIHIQEPSVEVTDLTMGSNYIPEELKKYFMED